MHPAYRKPLQYLAVLVGEEQSQRRQLSVTHGQVDRMLVPACRRASILRPSITPLPDPRRVLQTASPHATRIPRRGLAEVTSIASQPGDMDE